MPFSSDRVQSNRHRNRDLGPFSIFSKRILPALCAVLVAGQITGTTESNAQISSNWTNAAGGDWADASNWSTPSFPNADQPNPGDTYDATVDLTGAAYRIDTSLPLSLNSLTMDSADLTFVHQGNLEVADRFEVNAGLYVFTRQISGGVIDATGGRMRSVGSNAAFVNTQFDGVIDIEQSGSSNGILRVAENASVAGEINLIRNSGTRGSALVFEGTSSGPARAATLGGDTTINLRAGTFGGSLRAERNVTLTIAPTATVRGGSLGTSSTIEAQGFFPGTDPTIVNQGLVVSDLLGGGSFSIVASDTAQFINQGELRAESGNTIRISTPTGSFLQESSGSVVLNDGIFATGAGTAIVPEARLLDGTLMGNGTVEGSLELAGVLDVGLGGSGQLNFGASLQRGSLSLTETASSRFDIGGTNPGEPGGGGYDRVIVRDELALGGELLVSLINDFGASIADTDEFTLFDLSSDSDLSGAFTNVANGDSLTTTDGSVSFQVHYGTGSLFDPNQVVLSNATSTIPEPSTGIVWLLAATVGWSARRRTR